MINYKKYELMKECLFETFKVYAATLDTADYVPIAHLEKTHKWILKTMKKKQREIAREDRKYQRSLKKLIKLGFVIDTTSKEYVLSDIDPAYINFNRMPSLMSGQQTVVTPTESSAEENFLEENLPSNNAEENITNASAENASGENVQTDQAEEEKNNEQENKKGH